MTRPTVGRCKFAPRLTWLLSSASAFVIAGFPGAYAQQATVAAAGPGDGSPIVTAQAEQLPESVLVTGSLIHGTAAIGVPVTSFGTDDFKQTGSLTIGDLFRDVPAVYEIPQNDVVAGGGYIARDENVNLRNLSTHGPRQLLLIDGMRFPNQGRGGCQTDPSIIPQIAVDRVDLLTDGASATYGSDAVVGVINVLLKRGYDGALTQLQYSQSTDIGHPLYTASQLFGRTWDGGDVTVSYEWYEQQHTPGTARPYFTQNFFTYQGLDNRQSIINSDPGIVTIGAATLPAGSPAGFSANLGTSCNNCYSIPKGQNGVGLNWNTILANPGVQNEVNLWRDSWAEPDQQRNAATLTFDQKVLDNVSFFADGWYSNRRADMLGQSSTNSLNGISVPTSNPYYPVGAPAGLRINIDLNPEIDGPDRVVSEEIADRYDFGFNLTLPFGWNGKLYGAVTEEHNTDQTTGTVNQNAVSAALGWTINSVQPTSTSPFVISSYTKPSTVPYLNVFCDPSAFTCNTPATMSYLTGYVDNTEWEIVHEYGATADGPIFDLPGGQIKAALGGIMTATDFFTDALSSNANNVQITNQFNYSAKRTVYSAFSQFDIPIIGDNFTLPLVEKFVVDASVRYDHYSDFGSTTNPKVAANWQVVDGLTLQATWGTAFRAPTFQEEGPPSAPTQTNIASGAPSNTVGTCPVVGAPAAAGSIAALIDPNCSAALQFLGMLGSGLNGVNYAIRPSGYRLQPETSVNQDLGFDFAPDDRSLKGLDIQVTYWWIKMSNVLNGYFGLAGVQNGELDNPLYTPAFLTAANDPNFARDVQAVISGPNSTIQSAVAPGVSVIADVSNRNIGSQAVNGVDFNASYDYDFDALGVWNTGITGTYIIDNRTQNGPGQPVISLYSSPMVAGNPATDSGGRMKYRARLGWANDDWSVTGFMNFLPHFNSDTAQLPPSCFLIGNPACNAGGLPQFAQYTQQYPRLTNYVPGLYWFDLAIGYKTGDKPANPWLKNIGLQLFINNILDKQAPFAYQINPPGGAQAHAYFSTTAGSSLGIDGRVIGLVLTKAW